MTTFDCGRRAVVIKEQGPQLQQPPCIKVEGVDLPWMIEPQVAMEEPKGLETVVPVWSQ